MSLPDSLYCIRQWLRTFPYFEGGVYFRQPEQDRFTLPLCLVRRVGGQPDGQQHDHPSIIMEVWGVDLKSAADGARLIAEAVTAFEYGPPFDVPGGNGGVIKGGTVNVGPMEIKGLSFAKRCYVDATFTIQGH